MSLTGVLGFTDLSQACRDLEKACKGDTELDAALSAIGQASAVCLRAASNLAAFRHQEPTLERLVG